MIWLLNGRFLSFLDQILRCAQDDKRRGRVNPNPYHRSFTGSAGVRFRARGRSVRLIFVGDKPAFVRLSEAKHLANEREPRFFSHAAQILRCRSG